MRLCWLLPSDRSGGISPVVLTCCHQAAKAGHEATMLMLTNPTRITSDDFRVESLGLLEEAAETPMILLKWLTENPQEIVFFNACGEFDPIIPYLPPQTKCIYVIHDTAPPYWRFALQEEMNLDAIIAVSKTVANKFRRYLKQPEKLSIIYNGAIFPELPPVAQSRPDDLLFLGGNNPTKGAFDVLQLWKTLIQLGFTGKLHWFGHCPPELALQVRQLPHAESIKLYGFVERKVIFDQAAASKVLLMLSRVEPFGMATIEAMSMGCVPVAWDIETGTKEIITPNETGLLAPLGNMQALAQQVLTACQNYETFQEAVIQRSRSCFNQSVMWEGYEMLIEQLATAPPLTRSKQGQQPIAYHPPIRRFQLLPVGLRSRIREFVGRSPVVSYWLRDLRGW